MDTALLRDRTSLLGRAAGTCPQVPLANISFGAGSGRGLLVFAVNEAMAAPRTRTTGLTTYALCCQPAGVVYNGGHTSLDAAHLNCVHCTGCSRCARAKLVSYRLLVGTASPPHGDKYVPVKLEGFWM